MNERAKRIKALVEQSGKTYQELEVMTGVKKSSLQRYAAGITTKIPMDVIEKLETAFNVPPGYIMGWSGKSADDLQDMGVLAAQMVMDQDAAEMVKAYMQLDQPDRQAIRDYIALDDADRHAAQLVLASMAAKNKKD